MKTKTLLSIIFCGLASTAVAQITLISDSFDDGGRTDGADADDAAWYYSAAGSGLPNQGSIGGLSNAMGNGGNNLAGNQMIVAALPSSVALALTGDYLQVTYSFSRTVNDNFHSNVRVGFFDIASIPNADNFGAANFNAALGYTVELPAEGQSGRRLRLREDIDVASNRLVDGQGNSTTQLLDQSGSAI